MLAPIHRLLLWALTLSLSGLSGCSNNTDSKPASPPAAKVGGKEIPVSVIDRLMARAGLGNANPQAVPALRRELLEKMIDQQLTFEQATRNKLDQAPDVLAQIEASRREVLSRAYLQSVAGALAKPSAEEVRKYYVEHPLLFAERRIFGLQEIIAAPGTSAEMNQLVVGQLHDGRPMDEIANWLQSRQVKFTRGEANRAAEQIPLELLSRIHALKDGQFALISSKQGFTIVKVASSQAAPLAESVAMQRIEQFLTNQRAATAIKLDLQQLRAKAGVGYFGEFARAAPDTAASAATAFTAGAPASITGPGESGK